MKKGFTLVELLGVIVILGVLAIITTVSVTGVMNDSRNSISKIQIKKIEEAAKAYYIKEGTYNDSESFETCVNLSYLISNGYIEGKEVKDASTGEHFNGSVKITYKSNQYSYEYSEDICPVIVCTAPNGTDTGDIVTCGTESFYVMGTSDENVSYGYGNSIVMMPVNNIAPVSSGASSTKQSENAGTVTFASSAYWQESGFSFWNYITTYDGVYSDYISSSIYNINSNIYPTLNAYETYLESIGVNVHRVRLLFIEETEQTTFGSFIQDPSNYWLGSAEESTLNIYVMGDDGVPFTAPYTSSYSIRPVVEIPISDVS